MTFQIPGYLPPPQQPSSQPGGGLERSDRPPSGPTIENIKKEPEYHRPSSTGPSPKPLNEKCSTPKTNSNTPTPNNSISQTPPLRQQSKLFLIAKDNASKCESE